MTNCILVVFGSPYAVSNFESIESVIVAYEDSEAAKEAAAQAIVGVNEINGKLPVSSGKIFAVGTGISRASIGKMGFGLPERVGLSSERLDNIDLLCEELIRDKSAPSCQVLVAKDGKIVYQKSFGFADYEGKRKITNDHIYDIASITKVIGTTTAVMKLYEEQKLDIYAPISNYLPQLVASNKAHLTLYDMMAHYAGLHPWIPFYKNTTIKSGKNMVPNPLFYSQIKSDAFSIPVTNKLFLKNEYMDSIWQQIYNSELRSSTSYKYSDLGFYLAYQAIEQITGKTFDQYLHQQFYGPLGLKKTLFNPIPKINPTMIVPSENDKYWRNQIISGNVHDMGAAMLGGVCGHAGLFSNTKEMAVIMQMFLNGGKYDGHQFFSNNTLETFTTRHERSTRRGIGFDMKETSGKADNMAELAPIQTYGHTGFTGTAAFVDPINNIIYIFLSNRTYPSMDNNRLHTKDYRQRIHNLIYKAM